LFVGAILVSATAAGAQDIDWEKVDAALGRKGAVSADVHRYGFPRSDLTVKLDGVTIKPALALGGWVAFKPMHGEVMVMGDLVLLETEVNPVMAKLIENGIEITAVHNHLLRANPAPFYIHVGGHGDAVKMAAAVRPRWRKARRHWKRLRPQRPHRPSISTSSSSTRLSAPKVGRMAGCTNSGTTPRSDQRRRNGCCSARPDGSSDRDQLSADRRRQGGDHRRFRARWQ
jgi:Domain of Unknown Function (DUF1259)